MLLATALYRSPAYYGMCSTDVYCSKQTGSGSAETITHHFFVSGIGQKKLSMQPKFVAQKMLVKTGNPANIRKWIARFYYFRHLYSAGSACVLLTIIAWVAHRYGQLYLHCSLIYFWVPSSCFCASDQPLWGWNNPVQRCLPVGGELHYPPEAVVASRTDWQTALMCNRRRPAATIIAQASIFSFNVVTHGVFCIRRGNSSRPAPSCPVIAAFASFSSLAFLSRWAL